MTTQVRNLFHHLPPPAECLALFIATLEIVPFGIIGLRDPSFFADGYGLPISRESDTSPASAKRSSNNQNTYESEALKRKEIWEGGRAPAHKRRRQRGGSVLGSTSSRRDPSKVTKNLESEADDIARL